MSGYDDTDNGCFGGGVIASGPVSRFDIQLAQLTTYIREDWRSLSVTRRRAVGHDGVSIDGVNICDR